ncbi:MAG: hypothetical protein C0615_06390 [Desulfuromonas sp.]|nr:MAG: hypothetical protein C0615_06390 [Desulfuromonas sp.]
MVKKKQVCEFLEDCEFYKKFGERQSNIWKAIFSMYCNGHSKSLCEVYSQRVESGKFSAPDIMPTGRPVSFVYKQLP